MSLCKKEWGCENSITVAIKIKTFQKILSYSCLLKKNQFVNDRPVLGVGIREILFFSFIFNNKYTKAYYEEAMYNYNLILLVDFRLNFSWINSRTLKVIPIPFDRSVIQLKKSSGIHEKLRINYNVVAGFEFFVCN